ncbi:NADP-dependent oxidoreductase [Paractinoplanes ferrugineus]|uniref:Oxidoreductase n=1 Tax=Paractinoplanes ferrugineus TaxID=113564 RepID=A0A919JBG2_9ACTN|nr:NADP-dependent oxidoreductase [Actinoplanes ferrugineus]GIE16224.1 oxidoreductase [Actinoplanes ferrugineus]
MTEAITFSEYGGPEVLTLVGVDEPVPAPGQVRIAVRAAGVNQLDWKIRSGAMAAVRPVQFPAPLGMEVAGIVDAVGDGVTAWRVGDEVLAQVQAGYATQVLAAAEVTATKPAQMSWEVAAALPVAADTAYRVLDELGVKSGETLLIHGAAGGVGTLATQFAVDLGVTVIGTASDANHDYLRSLGAVPIRYGDGLPARVREAAPQGVDAVLDCAGAGVLADSVEFTGDPARVATIADPIGARGTGTRFSSGFGGRGFFAEGVAQAARLSAAGTLQMPIWRTFALAEVAEAHRASAEGHLRGKIVLLPH